MKRKIIAISAIMAVMAMLCAQSVVADTGVTIHAWTDRVQYKPGETGTLYITVRNDLPDTDIIIKNIFITYDSWHAYVKDHWEGNQSFTDINEICGMKGGVYYREVTFKVPNGGRGVSATATIIVTLDKPVHNPQLKAVYISVVGPPVPITVTDLDTWMTSLGVLIVVCTIILAAVIFLSTRRARVPRMVAPPVSKTKAE